MYIGNLSLIHICIIRIYNYRDKNPTGSFYNVYYGEEIAFGNLTRMLLLIDDMMNQMDSPQASVPVSYTHLCLLLQTL